MQPLIRPPSEAYSHLVLAMCGCPHNQCTFCPTYKNRKFRLRNVDNVLKEFNATYDGEKRVFLADGDATVIPQQDLLKLIRHIKRRGPERISSYITPGSAFKKTLEELKELKDAGLDLVYYGVETGNEQLLKDIKKGSNRKNMIIGAKKVREAGIKLSVTVLLGLGGSELIKSHATDTATLLNEIQPDYIGALTLMIVNGTELYDNCTKGKFQELTKMEYLKELYILLKNLDLTNTIFRSNHASNYLPIGGTLPEDKESMLSQIKNVLDSNDPNSLRPEFSRGL